jgi:hypothetical protein
MQIFPNIHTNYKNHDWLSERAILAAKNKDVYELNIIQSNIQSEAVNTNPSTLLWKQMKRLIIQLNF